MKDKELRARVDEHLIKDHGYGYHLVMDGGAFREVPESTEKTTGVRTQEELLKFEGVVHALINHLGLCLERQSAGWIIKKKPAPKK